MCVAPLKKILAGKVALRNRMLITHQFFLIRKRKKKKTGSICHLASGCRTIFVVTFKNAILSIAHMAKLNYKQSFYLLKDMFSFVAVY